MKIVDVRATTVAMPLEAPLRHAIGAHWGRFIRTVVEVETDNGIIGLGELGGGGESAEAAVRGLLPYLKGHDPLQLEQMRWKIMNPTASLYNNRMQIHAALEMACMDAAGKHLGIRACDLLGGAMRERVPFASYLFYRLPDEKTGRGGEVDPEEIVAHARALKAEHGFKAHKLKGGVFAPDHDVEVTRALGAAFPNDGLRLDPNAAWSVEEAIRVGRAIEDLRNDYFEDPTWGLEGMRRVRNFVRIPTATNTVVVNFEQLATNIRLEAIDVVLLDTTFWGGLRQAHKAGQVLETFQYGASVHSSGELGIQLASMLHLGAALSNLSFAADAHYHHLVDDVIVGGKMKYVDGSIAVPQGPGLGVELDREKLAQYAEHYREVGGYTYDRDPTRPDWYAVLPEQRWADPRAR
ncbi:enolase C-terminal domain-like protein [Arsenicitalea aurantiaca]|uniref:enolase C-terminal domain-like protein n=1 Tax=Arsenicitalea aurantiaca TaxID=1783274 RepID=UPI001FCED282|nr:enolase C-terminal domain-like protein [Arsenicitalea aurantiaca]